MDALARYNFQYDVYDPSNSVAAQYWQMGVVQSAKDTADWQQVTHCVNQGLPSKEGTLFHCTKPDHEHEMWGCVRWKGAHWVYRFFLTGRDRFDRPGRYFFVLFKFDTIEHVSYFQIISIIRYLGSQTANPLDLKPLQNMQVESEHLKLNSSVKATLVLSAKPSFDENGNELKAIFARFQNIPENSHMALLVRQKKIDREYEGFASPKEDTPAIAVNLNKISRSLERKSPENGQAACAAKASSSRETYKENIPWLFSGGRSVALIIGIVSGATIGILSGFMIGKDYSDGSENKTKIGERTSIQIVASDSRTRTLSQDAIGKNMDSRGKSIINIPISRSNNMTIMAQKPIFWLEYKIDRPKTIHNGTKNPVEIELRTVGALPSNIMWEVNRKVISGEKGNKLLIELSAGRHEVSAAYDYAGRSDDISTEVLSITIPIGETRSTTKK